MKLTRREFLATAPASPLLSVPSTNLGSVISRADLVYEKPAGRSEEGIPIGNGRMGTLVWSTPTELHFQINRADVYANNSYTNSFFERNIDYCGGCGFVEIDFGAHGDAPLPSEGFRQHLSVYDGLLEIESKGVHARLLAWPARDVIAIELEDRRTVPTPVDVNLRMLRYASQAAPEHMVTVRTRSHTAASQLLVRDDRIVLTQEFREDAYCCKSAVAIGIVGRRAAARIPNEIEARLAAAPGAGSFIVLIASAASFDPNADVAADALRQLEAAAAKNFSQLAGETADWWHDFWSRGFVQLSSADGTAGIVERHYHYFLYLMAATSRGKFPPKFNGMLWSTGGDQRTWGAQHWFANLSCYYEALPAANRLDLMDPMFDMYSGMYEACAIAARQQWSSQGIYIPETVWFDGLEKLPDDIAAEMPDLYLLRKPWGERSQRFREFAQTKHPHSSRWNWIEKGSWVNGRWVIVERGAGPYGNVTHILGTTAKVAYLYWRRYQYSQDREWLRNRAYPMLKGAAEFYRNFPNVRKGADGKYHIHHVNSNESVWGAEDTDEDLSAMRGVFRALLEASKILNADTALRPVWQEFLDNLAPLATSDDTDALRPENYQGPKVFVRGRKPAVQARGFLPDGNSLPLWFFDLHREFPETANATFNALAARGQVGILSKVAIAGAALGRADAVRSLIPKQIQATGVLANRMTLREGAQALDAERLGRVAEALHQALLQSDPIQVFPAWPKEWDAKFKLRARGAFVVSAQMENGKVKFVDLESEAGGECRLRDPWREGKILSLQMRQGEKITLTEPRA